MAELRVLTFNVWGLHGNAKLIRERLRYIADELPSFDIVCLQEVWSKKDYEYLAKQLLTTVPYSHYFSSGIIGSGLCTFSRYSILAVYSHEFNVTGSIKDFADGEVFAGKGVLACLIRTPNGHVTVFNTHVNPRCRDNQLFELAQFINQTRKDSPMIVCGDFNTKPTHLSYKLDQINSINFKSYRIDYSLMTKVLGLEDVYADDPVDTCDLKSNSFTKDHMAPKRIDYIFYSVDKLHHTSDQPLRLKSRSLVLTGKVPGKDFPYSDHEGVEAVFLLKVVETMKLTYLDLDVDGAQVLHDISEQINKLFLPLSRRYASYHKVVAHWVFLGILVLLLGVFMTVPAVYNFLMAYHMQWLSAIIPSLASAAIIIYIFIGFNEMHLMRNMHSNLNQIRTTIEHQTPIW